MGEATLNLLPLPPPKKKDVRLGILFLYFSAELKSIRNCIFGHKSRISSLLRIPISLKIKASFVRFNFPKTKHQAKNVFAFCPCFCFVFRFFLILFQSFFTFLKKLSYLQFLRTNSLASTAGNAIGRLTCFPCKYFKIPIAIPSLV